ncbi:MAG: flagellar biosynthetic protein FliO [Planctomycetes bacterium]|nr:flagellar biosynthetic protein FliO [Planctomycetota bacterium]
MKQVDRRWLWAAPALAVLLVLGTWDPPARGGPPDSAVRAEPPANPVAPGTATATAPRQQLAGAGLPRFPSLWEVGLALAGVLLAGGVAVWVLARVRNPTATAGRARDGRGPIALRQSLRLSAKNTVHAVEFDGRVLLIGESEHGTALLAASDAEREAAAVAERDDGAEPRDLLIPRPARAAARRAAPAPDRRHPEAQPAQLAHFEELLSAARGAPRTETEA